jgi:hypothetical protein
MTDLTYEILKAKYASNNSPVQVTEPEIGEVEVQKASITLEQLIIKVRHDLLTSWGLDASGRHEFADDIVALTAIQRLAEYNVTDLPPAYKEKT